MKTLIASSFVVLTTLVTFAPQRAAAINPEARAAVAREFGEGYLRNVLLVTSYAEATDPVSWNLYAHDPHHTGELVRTSVTFTNGHWEASPGGAGKLLNRVPKQRLDFKRLKFSAAQVRAAAAQAAMLAKTSFAKVEFQLAANDETSVPEWGLVLQDGTGAEVGFCIVSGETGAVTFQDWSNDASKPKSGQSSAERKAEDAAQKVKQGVRKAWNWTERAGRQTGTFFRELFR